MSANTTRGSNGAGFKATIASHLSGNTRVARSTMWDIVYSLGVHLEETVTTRLPTPYPSIRRRARNRFFIPPTSSNFTTSVTRALTQPSTGYRSCHCSATLPYPSYARAKQDWKLERNMYPEVYGRMGGDLVSQATSFIPGAAYLPFYTRPLLSRAGNIAGSASGEVIARQKEKQITAQSQSTHVRR